MKDKEIKIENRAKYMVKSGRKRSVRTPLTSIDSHAGHFNIYVVYFFKSNPDIEKIKKALAETLLDFPEVEGRYKGKRNDTMEIISCNDGIPFLIDTIETTFEEVNTKEMKNKNWDKFVENIDFSEVLNGKEAPATVKITKFKDEGFALGITMNHSLTDGNGFYYFIDSWAKKCRKEEYKKPVLDRSMFENNPGIKEECNENNVYKKIEGFMCLDKKATEEHYQMYMDLNPESLENDVVNFTREEIRVMKKDVMQNMEDGKWISTNDVFSIHVWKVLSMLTGSKTGKSKLLCSINLREKTEPKLSNEFFGNCSFPIVVEKEYEELINADVAKIALELREKIIMYDNFKIEEQVKWIKQKQGIHVFADFDPFINEVNISNFIKFPIYDADFGSGKAVNAYIPPVICPGVVRFMPDAQGEGIDVYLSLYKKDMEKLRSEEWMKLFKKYGN